MLAAKFDSPGLYLILIVSTYLATTCIIIQLLNELRRICQR
jgi:hypothetical protein